MTRQFDLSYVGETFETLRTSAAIEPKFAKSFNVFDKVISFFNILPCLIVGGHFVVFKNCPPPTSFYKDPFPCPLTLPMPSSSINTHWMKQMTTNKLPIKHFIKISNFLPPLILFLPTVSVLLMFLKSKI